MTDKFNEFEAFLSESGKVPKDKTRYYLYWARRFLKQYNYQPDNINTQQVEKYLDSLEADEGVADWQVKQAADAVILYVEQFLTKQLEQSRSYAYSKPQAHAISPLWKHVIDETRKTVRLRHYSLSTEKSYIAWVQRFRAFIAEKDPQRIDTNDIRQFLTHLAVHDRVSASTQNQAFNALLFICRHVLRCELNNLDSVVRAKQRIYLPVVLSKEEIKRMFSHLDNQYLLMAQIMYGGGLRLSECLRLRVKDVDLQNDLIMVRSGKGDKDR
jgi:hypothetical protein